MTCDKLYQKSWHVYSILEMQLISTEGFLTCVLVLSVPKVHGSKHAVLITQCSKSRSQPQAHN